MDRDRELCTKAASILQMTQPCCCVIYRVAGGCVPPAFSFGGGGEIVEKVCVFVDGENFRHSIVDLFFKEFRSDDYLPKNAKWGELFDWVAETAGSPDATRLRAYWYVIEHVDFYPYRFPDLKQERAYRLFCRHRPYEEKLRPMDDGARFEEMKRIKYNLLGLRRKMEERARGWSVVQSGISTAHKAIELRRAGSITYNLFTRSLA